MIRFIPLVAVAALLAGCAERATPPTVVPSPPAPPPPPAALSPIHRDISALEQSFHLRAGLNVAALSCVQQSGSGIVSDYNRFLAVRKPQLAAAYEAKASRYRAEGGQWQRALDTHMTQLYNHFASPDGQAEFCRRAAVEVKQAITADPDGFVDWATGALARIDAPFAAPRPMIASTRAAPMGLVGGSASDPFANVSGMTLASPTLPAGWRIQLGAFSSRAAAEAAWKDVAGRSAAIGSMQPHFELAPRKGPGPGMVRLQVKDVPSQRDAIALCAHAATAGLDCIPVKPA